MKLLVLGNALLLVPPPGWCCASPSSQSEKPAPAGKACCHCAPEPEQAPADAPPVQPEASCCCRIDSTSPPQPEEFTPDLASVLLPAVALPLGDNQGLGDGLTAAAFSPVRTLHLLHCVWRC